MNCVHLGLMIDAGDSGIKAIGTHVTDMKRGGALKHRHLVGKVTLQQVIYHAVEMKGPWANDAALQRSARRWDLWRRIYWPIRVFSGCSDDRRQMVAGLQNVTPFPRKTLRAATVILLARFLLFISLIFLYLF